LDLSRKRLDWHALAANGEPVGEGACPPDRDGLAHLVHGFDPEQGPVLAAIESMTGARFVHDQLELVGWDVRIADAQRAKGLAPLACKTDRIDAWVLAELAGISGEAALRIAKTRRSTGIPPVDAPLLFAHGRSG
jgi:transposase